MNTALLSSDYMGWETPEAFLYLVRQVASGPIGLDPCTTEANPTDALAFFTPATDGLAPSWEGHGLVFVNPPYGRELRHWIAKCHDEGGLGTEIIALIPARTDTVTWQKHVRAAAAVCFLRGRITFRGAPAPAPFPSAAVYWGQNERRFHEVFADRGWTVFNPTHAIETTK